MFVVAFHGNVETFPRAEINTRDNGAGVLENIQGTDAMMTSFGFLTFIVVMGEGNIGVFHCDDITGVDVFIGHCVPTYK